MKHLFLLVSALALFGCTVSVNSNDDSGKKVPGPVDSSQMQLKTASGYRTTAINSVSSVDVSFTDLNGGSVQLMRHFDGAYAQAILKQLQLNSPQEPGLPSAMTMGTIVLRSDSPGTATKKFWVLNSGMLQDSDFPEALYRSVTTLDQQWLLAQPPLSASYNIASCLYHVDNFGKWQLNFGVGMTNLPLGHDESHVAGGSLTSAQTGYCNLVGGTGRDTSLEVVLMTATANDSLMMSQPCRFSGDGLAVSHSDKTLGIGEMAFVDFRVDGVLNRNLVYLGTKGEANSSSWANSACLRLMRGFTL